MILSGIIPFQIGNKLEVRPTLEVRVYHQDTFLETVRILLDSGADKSYLSWDFCKKYNLVSARPCLINTTYGQENGEEFEKISFELIGINKQEFRLNFDNVVSIVDRSYDYQALLGMDLFAICVFTIDFKNKIFNLGFNE